MKVTGNQQAGQEIITALEQWDRAICSLDLHEIVVHCSADVSLFDVSSELQGISAYQQIWTQYEEYFQTGLRVFRDQIQIHAESDLAFVYCLSKIDVESGVPTPNISWCRTTICYRKKNDQWKIVHQHISLPIDIQGREPFDWKTS